MIRFPVEPVAAGEYAVYVEDSSQGNDRALFLVFNSQATANNAADLFTNISRQYNQLFQNGSGR